MTDEIGLRKDMDRAAKAKALLDNDMLNEGFNLLRAEYIKAWEATKPLQTAEREKLWVAVIVLDAVRSNLESTVTSGVIAQRELSDAGLI